MLKQEIKKIKSGKKEVREFALTLGIFFGMLSGLLFWRHRNFIPFLTVSLVFLLFAIPAPVRLLAPVHKAWMTLSLLMGWVMTRVILSILFYGVITPISFFSRLSGKRFLDLEFRKNQPSYWVPRPKKEFDKSIWEKQY